MLAYFLYGLFFVSCLVLVITVLLQPGKTDAGALFTSNISSTAFGPRGTQSVLSKITITVAGLFMLSGLLLSLPAITGNVSVLQTTTENTETKPVVNAEANTSNVNSANINIGNSSNSDSNSQANSTNSNTGNSTVNSNTPTNK